MAQKRKADQTKLIVKTALELAAGGGWSRLSMQAVAKKAKLKTEAVTALFPDKWALLKWVLKDIQERTNAAVKNQMTDNWRDNLFEIMMTRVELAAPHKKAFASLPEAFRHEPEAALKFSRLFFRTMRHIVQQSGLEAGVLKPAYVAAFSILYVSIVRKFLEDGTKDHSKTMAALDQHLGLFEEFVDFARCGKDRE